jgi:hypothetical protein
LPQTNGADFQFTSYLCTTPSYMKGVVILAFHHKDDKLLSIYRNIKSHGYFGKLRLNMPYHRHFSPDIADV